MSEQPKTRIVKKDELDEPQAEAKKAKAQDRSPRKSDSREKTERVKSWAPPSILPEPEPRDGYVHRWVRISMVGTADNQNLSMRMREGWEPCRSEDYPEMETLSDPHSKWGEKGNIEVGGLLLCRCATEIMEQRDQYYRQQADAQMQAVDNQLLRESDPRMPIHRPERKSSSTFGQGRPTG